MVKIADQNKDYAYIYAETQEEIEIINKLFKTQIVAINIQLEYEGLPAVLVRKSK